MKLTHVSDKVLLVETLHWVHKERQALIQVLWRLKEIDERKLFATLRCGSLFEYCVKVLKYSEGQASRRVTASRMLKQIPGVISYIESGEINLSQLNQANKFFKEENIKSIQEKKAVFEKIKGKTTRETDRILWELKKIEGPRKVTITLNEETVDELKKIQAIKAHSCPDLDTLLMKMSAEVIQIWDPTLVYRKRKLTKGDTRYVGVQVRAYIWERDKGKCQNCESSYGLEIDHILPFAAGGKTEAENLRLLCKQCNLRKSLEYFGPVRSNPNFSSQ